MRLREEPFQNIHEPKFLIKREVYWGRRRGGAGRGDEGQEAVRGGAGARSYSRGGRRPGEGGSRGFLPSPQPRRPSLGGRQAVLRANVPRARARALAAESLFARGRAAFLRIGRFDSLQARKNGP